MGAYEARASRVFARALELVDSAEYMRRRNAAVVELMQDVYNAAAGAISGGPATTGRIWVNKTVSGEALFAASKIADGLTDLAGTLRHMRSVALSCVGGPLRVLWWEDELKAEEVSLRFDVAAGRLTAATRNADDSDYQDAGEHVAQLVVEKLCRTHNVQLTQ